jgi:hypothetical protein
MKKLLEGFQAVDKDMRWFELLAVRTQRLLLGVVSHPSGSQLPAIWRADSTSH